MNNLSLRSNTVVPSALYTKRPNSMERFFNDKGDMNANSRKEVIETLATLFDARNNGQLTMASGSDYQAELATVKAERRAHFVQAYHDRSSNLWSETGAAIGADVSDVADRQGFMRRFLMKGEVTQGNIVRIHVKTANVTAMFAASASQLKPEFVREKYIVPPEFYVNGNVQVEERDIQQGAGDILEDAFKRTQEQIMVKEDIIYKSLLDALIGVPNPQQVLAGGLTPSSLASMREQVITWGLSAYNLLMAANVWTDIVGNAATWANLFDPVSQFEIVQTGYLGTLLGLGIVTDGWRDPNQKVLQQGEVYIISTPDTHGVYTDRGPVSATPVDHHMVSGTPSRGWYFSELLSMTVTNGRSFCKGIRS